MRCILGLFLIDAEASALNNAQPEPGRATENIVAVKKIKTKQGDYPYVSAQAVRYWWRQTLLEKYKWEMSPITRETKIAMTEADPVKYPDDDIFGYMSAKKIMVEVKGKTKSKNLTVTRTSPLKNSVLISVSPVKIVNDFGVMSRQDGDPVPYEHEFYKAILKGIFSLNIDEVGKFTMINKSGFQNIREEQKEEYIKLEDVEWDETNKVLRINEKIRDERIKDTLNALAYLFGGA
ncbi:MAG: type I-B CRISPR-associated protein Cas7/Cst2/DevR, partial [Promethearchaeota archaeon]